MKLATALTLLMTVTASAQTISSEQPTTTMTQYDKTTGQIMGTTTIVGGKAYLRDKNGGHYATLIIDADGTRRMVDVNGNPIDAADIKRILEAQ